MRQYRDDRASGEPVTWADVRAARKQRGHASRRIGRKMRHAGLSLMLSGILLAFGIVALALLVAAL